MKQTNSHKYTRRNCHFGDIYVVDLKGDESAQHGRRPCVITSNEVGNKYSPNVVICPMTTSIKKTGMPTHIVVKADNENGLTNDSMILCENPVTIPKSRLGKKLGRLSDTSLSKFASVSPTALGSIAYISLDALIQCWYRCKELMIA